MLGYVLQLVRWNKTLYPSCLHEITHLKLVSQNMELMHLNKKICIDVCQLWDIKYKCKKVSMKNELSPKIKNMDLISIFRFALENHNNERKYF